GNTSGGSNPSLSAIKPDYQAFVVFTLKFVPKTVKVGCFLHHAEDQLQQKLLILQNAEVGKM
ncbi:MAG: hypothetical protein K2L46_02635, partial [Paramuribaculum sp.]|nr:hypothetical protein [Paramuribaculum sp.]